MPYLNKDILSNSKGRIYAKKGEEVKVISSYENVLIVEDKKGERFPCPVDAVGEIKK